MRRVLWLAGVVTKYVFIHSITLILKPNHLVLVVLIVTFYFNGHPSTCSTVGDPICSLVDNHVGSYNVSLTVLF